MATLSDLGLRLLQTSVNFYPNTNFSLQGPSSFAMGPPDQGTKLATLDEFLRALPFTPYTKQPLSPITPSRPITTEPTPAFLPGDTALPPSLPSNEAFFFPPNGAFPSMQLRLEDTVDADYETFLMRRLGAEITIDKFQKKQMDLPEGFDPRPALLRTASVAVGRVLSRFALNNVDPGSGVDGAYKLLGLARYYDGNFGGAAADPQVIKATDPLSLAQVRRLMRKVTPSESGYGAGPNALVTSLRCRDLLISLERAAGTSPDYRLDPRTNEVRYHLDGVPVYVAPLREDEDTAGAAPAFKTTGEPYTYNRTSIYALRLGGFSGVRMLHFGGDSAKYGVQIDEITPSAGNAALGYQVHGYYALFIPERQACARLWGIDISAEV